MVDYGNDSSDPNPRRFKWHLRSVWKRSPSQQDRTDATKQPTSSAGHGTLPTAPASLVALHPKKNPTAQHPTKKVPGVSLDGLWAAAYKELAEDPHNAKLVTAYEKCLAQQGATSRDVCETDIVPRLRSVIESRLEEIEHSRVRFTLAGREIVVNQQVRRVADKILSVKEFVTTAVSAEPHAALAWAGALVLLNPVTNFFAQDARAMDGFEYIALILARYGVVQRDWSGLYSAARQSEQLGDGRELETLGLSVREQMVKMYKAIIRYQISLARHYEQLGLVRFLEDVAAPQDWAGMLQEIKDIEMSVTQHLSIMSTSTLAQIDGTLEMLQGKMGASYEVMNEVRDNTLTNKYLQFVQMLAPRIAPQARLDSFESQYKTECFEGTQIEVLEQIHAWVVSSGPDHMYWLRGMAGTGKSTIARTIATQCRHRKFLPETICLGGTFFFDQNQGELSTAPYLFPTLCTAIADCLPEIRSEIYEVNKDHSNISYESLSKQWTNLILAPFLRLEKQNRLPAMTLVVVIDGLDECKSGRDGDNIGTILNLITEASRLSSIRLKFLLTSRPESHILSRFEAISRSSTCLQISELHKIEPSTGIDVPDDDITKFLRTKTREITKRHLELKPDWPGEERLDELKRKVDGLWIYAATACLFIGDEKIKYADTVEKRLNNLLRGSGGVTTPQGTLDELYLRILQSSVMQSVVPEEVEGIRSLFQSIVGTIVVLRHPLSTNALSALSTIPVRDIKTQVNQLGSVISMGKDQGSPIRLAHLSFKEFLVDSTRCTDKNFQISREERHAALLQNCLDTLESTLQQDICGFADYAILQENIPAEHVARCLPDHVQYSCLYWVEHLQLANDPLIDNGRVHRFLKKHTLNWLEALSILGRMYEGTHAVIMLSDHAMRLQADGSSAMRELVFDIRRFVLNCRSTIEYAPLQIYQSALIFCPEQSLVRRQYQSLIDQWLIGAPISGTSWSPLLLTLENRSRSSLHVFDVALSPDGSIIASDSALWNTATGVLLKVLEPLGGPCKVAFSLDGNSVMSLSCQGHVRIWDVFSGRLIKEVRSSLDDHWGQYLHSFSPDKAYTVSCGTTVEILNLDKGELVKAFKPHPSEVVYMVFSPNSELLATTSTEGQIRVWEVATGEMRHDLRTGDGLQTAVECADFCQKSEMIGAGSGGTISIWSVATGELLQRFAADLDGIQCVTFSPVTNRLVVTGRSNTSPTVQVWNWSSGEVLRTIHTDCAGLVRFSSDGRLFTFVPKPKGPNMALYPGKPVQVWDATTGQLVACLENHTLSLGCAVFAENKPLLVSGHETVRLWDLSCQPVEHDQHEQPAGRAVHCTYLSPDHRTAVTFGEKFCVWDLRTATLRHQAAYEHSDRVFFSPDGKLFVNSTVGQAAAVQDLRSGEVILALGEDSGQHYAFSANGTLLAGTVAEAGARVHIWGLESQRLLHALDVHGTADPTSQAVTTCVALSPSGRFLAVAIRRYRCRRIVVSSDDQALPEPEEYVPESSQLHISIWEVSAGTRHLTVPVSDWHVDRLREEDDDHDEASRVEGPYERDWGSVQWEMEQTTACKHLTWSPDGTILAALYDHGQKISAWEFPDGNQLYSSIPVPAWTDTLVFSPRSGEFVASTMEEVQLWNARTGQLIGAREVPGSRHALRFSSDGATIRTEAGRLDVRSFFVPEQEHSRRRDLRVGDWIVRGSRNVLFLPHDYRTERVVVTDHLVVLGHHSGRVSFLRLPDAC
ncbi:hypothetical protein ASPACDRAFT_38612 [Aspergillus aculeatus ATCC 16872]|uniref:Mitochondrial division protein 1 n=1 Tax=Aspergillus aculeatus (strain ATCC 16872 / CBS 172.66 / WB 5094) TaxID=690307 RepID=A0A1L9X9K6_ASPA1|nr:uncharacterized protein ASPACDRAFT_38612 [Aspergillus aculeatus ATCC 16872]OJK05044.1 hypothetical protein ASPACDRAFT_38612 [Aspergillus aculeatus ATCC 16872]